MLNADFCNYNFCQSRPDWLNHIARSAGFPWELARDWIKPGTAGSGHCRHNFWSRYRVTAVTTAGAVVGSLSTQLLASHCRHNCWSRCQVTSCKTADAVAGPLPAQLKEPLLGHCRHHQLQETLPCHFLQNCWYRCRVTAGITAIAVAGYCWHNWCASTLAWPWPCNIDLELVNVSTLNIGTGGTRSHVPSRAQGPNCCSIAM